MSSSSRYLAPIALVLAALALAPAASAQPHDEAAQSAARTLGLAALELYDKGDYPRALEKFEHAYLVYKAPTLGLGSARCMVKLGKLVAASERYNQVARTDLGPAATAAFRQAKQEAEREGAEITARLPKITLLIAGASPDEVSVTLDGRPIDASSLGVAVPVDPGSHKAEVRRGATKVAGEATLAEGEGKTIVLLLPPESPGAASSQGGAPSPDQAGDPGASRRTLAWVAIGAGAAGIVVGGVLTGATASKKSFLDGEGGCVDGRCPPGAQADVDAYNGLRIGSTVAFLVGAASGALGVTLLLTAPSAKTAAKATNATTTAKSAENAGEGPWIGVALSPSAIGLRGAF